MATLDHPDSSPGLKIDLGCGSCKKADCIGLDSVAAPGVDYVLDLTKERFPFDDNSVEYVFSSHFFEHIPEPNNVFSELGRVCRDGAQFEFWTPYTFTEEGFFYGHVAHFSEKLWLQFCYYHRDAFIPLLHGRWLLKSIIYVVPQETVQTLQGQSFGLDFAIKHFKDVVVEFGVEIEFRRNLELPARLPARYYATTRYGQRMALTSAAGQAPPKRVTELEAAIQRLEEDIARKNSHIQHLERTIARFEAGRVMRLLSWVESKRRGRKS